MTAVYKKEMRAYFNNPTGYIVIALMLAVVGIFATYYNFKSGYPDFEYVLYSVTFIFLILIPVLTMHAFAEEKRLKTDQLLYSLPIKLSNVVLGKFFAMLTVYAISLLVMCLYPVILSIYGTVNFAASYGAIFGFLLLGGALISIGMFMSTFTESQAISAFIAFLALLLVYLMNDLASMMPSTAIASAIAFCILAIILGLFLFHLTKNIPLSCGVGGALVIGVIVLYILNNSMFESAFPNLISNLSLFNRFANFVNGIFDIGAIVFYISISVLFIFFSVQSLEKRRWS